MSRDYDLIIYGASGFTGRQAAAYIAENAPHLRWALAGRSPDKLRKLRSSLGEAWVDLPLICADAGDGDALRTLAEATQVVLTTAGPFALYGENLVRACVEAGTDYVDITGETPWVRHLIDTYHARASRKGVRIVNFCGVDSIPSDLSALFLVRETQRRLGEDLNAVQGLFQVRGGLNGGTLASALNMADSQAFEQLEQPYLLNPGEEQLRQDPKDLVLPGWDPVWWVWTAPFFMAPVNTRVVRRSEALYRLHQEAYSERFIYQEAAWFDELLPAKTLAMSGGVLAFSECLRLPAFVDWLRKNGPQPGEGPSQESMDRGSLSCWFRGETPSGQVVKSRFYCSGDPGNRVTVKLLCESALMLIENRDELPAAFPGGVLTPATGLGEGLIKRLRQAGVNIEWVSPNP